jgi:hypothetical protein
MGGVCGKHKGRASLHGAVKLTGRFSPTRHVLMAIYTGIRLPLVAIAVCGAATGPQLPDDQIAVCKAFNQGAAEFYPLQQNWKRSDQESNGVARTASQDGLKQKIDTLFRTRNRTVLSSLPSGRLKGWIGKLDRLEVVELDSGDGIRRYIEIAGNFDCSSLPIDFRAERIEATPKLAETLAPLKIGDSITLDASLLKHDVEHQPPEDAIEWGGILWGPLGGLWGDDAFNKPRFQIKVTRIAVP